MRPQRKRVPMKIVILTDSQRKMLIRNLRPSLDDPFSYQNLNLLTVVYDPEKKFYLTGISFLSGAIRRDGDPADQYCFAVWKHWYCHKFFCKQLQGTYISQNTIPIPGISEEDILSAIAFYDDEYLARKALGKEEAGKYGVGYYGFAKWYLKNQ